MDLTLVKQFRHEMQVLTSANSKHCKGKKVQFMEQGYLGQLRVDIVSCSVLAKYSYRYGYFIIEIFRGESRYVKISATLEG